MDSSLENTLQHSGEVVASPVFISVRDLEEAYSTGSSDFLPILTANQELNRGLPKTKSGIVIGSGENSDEFKQKGLQTLDIDPKHNPDYIIDAQSMRAVIPSESQDYIFAEYIDIDPTGNFGINLERLIKQVTPCLKEGGTFIWITNDMEGKGKTDIPQRKEVAELLQENGLNTYVVVNEESRTKSGVGVCYYGFKPRSK